VNLRSSISKKHVLMNSAIKYFGLHIGYLVSDVTDSDGNY